MIDKIDDYICEACLKALVMGFLWVLIAGAIFCLNKNWLETKEFGSFQILYCVVALIQILFLRLKN